MASITKVLVKLGPQGNGLRAFKRDSKGREAVGTVAVNHEGQFSLRPGEKLILECDEEMTAPEPGEERVSRKET